MEGRVMNGTIGNLIVFFAYKLLFHNRASDFDEDDSDLNSYISDFLRW